MQCTVCSVHFAMYCIVSSEQWAVNSVQCAVFISPDSTGVTSDHGLLVQLLPAWPGVNLPILVSARAFGKLKMAG